MKKVFIIILALLAFDANAQLLWKVSGNNLASPSYIMGTHHMASIDICDRINGFKDAFECSEQIIGEIIMEQLTAEKMSEHVLLPNNRVLSSYYNVEEVIAINNFIKPIIGNGMAAINNLKPLAALQYIEQCLYCRIIPEFNPMSSIDIAFQHMASAQGKDVIAIESVEEQMNLLFDTIDIEKQAEMLLDEINDDRLEEKMRNLYSAYINQDTASLNQLLSDLYNNENYDSMILARNRKWIDFIETAINSKPSFIAVGVLHLLGENGILSFLKEKGYNVQPIN